ncbi:MAG: Outer membrane low permeability porin, OprD family [uncultured Paraburkholderia sp.]|nr:MAG: Outer membrane low permeability porin, OprD family [uncultured Paraburkholderia sp.]CAH2799175.1 MAG: Outer membrane low permeability porin, OprD family [uncultured Paraburkholderia sp.]CAH2934108.1 MAG: Outer membrane low permeability porin, OprD family [uncultured Paraburkholderia sp.]
MDWLTAGRSFITIAETSFNEKQHTTNPVEKVRSHRRDLLCLHRSRAGFAANAYADDSVTPPAPEASNAAPAAQALSSPAQVSQAQPANKRRADQGGQIRNDQPDTTNALVNAEASQTVTPPEPPSSQAASKGFIADSHLNLQLRNYADYFQAPPSLYRHAWVQGAQVNYESGFTQGLVGFGVDASLFGALKLDSGNGAGNMVHVGKSGGGTRIDRLTYLGGTWHYAKNGEMSLYID